MSDLISRDAAIEALCSGALINYNATGDNYGMVKAINVIKSLPSAEPERKKGRWIKVNGKSAINCSACLHCS